MSSFCLFFFFFQRTAPAASAVCRIGLGVPRGGSAEDAWVGGHGGISEDGNLDIGFPVVTALLLAKCWLVPASAPAPASPPQLTAVTLRCLLRRITALLSSSAAAAAARREQQPSSWQQQQVSDWCSMLPRHLLRVQAIQGIPCSENSVCGWSKMG